MTDTTAPRSRFRKWLLISLSVIIFIMSFIIYWKYYNTYSSGDRVGKDLKISTRGNVFKTCEGYFTEGCRDLMGQVTTFTFSVADDAVEAKLLQLQLEPSACIRLKYEQKRSTLPWRGETVYIIVEAERLEEKQ